MRGITEAERALMTHITRWGSDGYPVYKCGSKHWAWGRTGVNGPPVVFPTKRAAIASFERFYDVLLDAHAGRI